MFEVYTISLRSLFGAILMLNITIIPTIGMSVFLVLVDIAHVSLPAWLPGHFLQYRPGYQVLTR